MYEIKIGTILICKKNVSSGEKRFRKPLYLFKKDQSYRIFGHYYEPYPAYWKHEPREFFIVRGERGNEIHYDIDTIYEDFYNNVEMRKFKLKKLNEKN